MPTLSQRLYANVVSTLKKCFQDQRCFNVVSTLMCSLGIYIYIYIYIYITRHIRTKGCVCSLNDFNIIGRETDFHLRLIKESLFIKLYDCCLNKQQKSTELFLF